MNLKATWKKNHFSKIFLTVKELKNLKKYILKFLFSNIFMIIEFYNISSKLSEHNHKNQ